MSRRVVVLVLAIGVLAVAAVGVRSSVDIPFVGTEQTKAIGRYEGTSPFALAPVGASDDALLTADDVTDVDAQYVTDPFVVRDDDEWFMFLGVRKESDNRGAIGLATSDDGESWAYQGLVLEEPFHTSFPHVLSWEGQYYMIPESAGSGALRLYRADDFPTSWVLVDELLQGDFTDATPFQRDGKWWMFVGANPRTNDRLELYVAEELSGPWVEHPASPVVNGNADIARPGGRVVEHDGRLHRVAQDDAPEYGNGVWAFEIVELTPQTYREVPVGPEQIISDGGADWNNKGLGHLELVQVAEDRWVGFVSGQGEDFGVGFDR